MTPSSPSRFKPCPGTKTVLDSRLRKRKRNYSQKKIENHPSSCRNTGGSLWETRKCNGKSTCFHDCHLNNFSVFLECSFFTSIAANTAEVLARRKRIQMRLNSFGFQTQVGIALHLSFIYLFHNYINVNFLRCFRKVLQHRY